jgi:protease IV
VENKKMLIYIMMGLFAASLIAGVLLIIRSVPKEQKVTTKSLDFNLKQEEGVAIVYLYGPISVGQQDPSMPFFASGSDRVVTRLDKIRKDPLIKAVVLRINTPGGSVGATQEICEEIEKIKQSGKKVVASMGDVAASGGYYVATTADKIMANPGTITGSIGVIAEMGNVEELFKKIGVKIEVIKSGKHKDIGSPVRQMTQEERKMLQDLINNAYEQFIAAVVKGRNMPYEKVKQLADGSIYTGQQAKDNGLIDELGNLEDAVKLAGQLAGIKGEPNVIKEYNSLEKFFEMFGQKFDDNAVNKIFNKQGFRLAYSLE